jgi:hypothetical protein
MKKLSIIKLYNSSKYTTLVLVVSSSKIGMKILKFTMLHPFFEAALDQAASANRFLKAALDPATSTNSFIEVARSRAASKDRSICKGG